MSIARASSHIAVARFSTQYQGCRARKQQRSRKRKISAVRHCGGAAASSPCLCATAAGFSSLNVVEHSQVAEGARVDWHVNALNATTYSKFATNSHSHEDTKAEPGTCIRKQDTQTGETALEIDLRLLIKVDHVIDFNAHQKRQQLY